MPGPAEHACYAVTPPGLEALAAAELRTLGIRPGGIEPGGVGFAADSARLYAANLHLRTAGRVLVRLAEFPARAFYELERKAKRVDWSRVLRPGEPAAFRVTSRKSKLYHQDGIAERLLAASGASEDTGDSGDGRDNGDTEYAEGAEDTGDSGATENAERAENTDVAGDALEAGAAARGRVTGAQLFVVRVMRDVVTISADSSGELLHRRGYRLESGKAPVRETLAAGMLLAAGYDGSRPLVDPFAGSGTIPIEAALLARRIPPGWRRRFAFERWPGFEPDAWSAVRAAAESAMLSQAPAAILGSDRDDGAVRAASANAERAGVAPDVAFRRATISELEVPAEAGFVVTNPPYGLRIGEARRLRDLHARLGQVLRERCPGWTAAVLTASAEHRRAAGLGLEPAWQSTNGGVQVELGVGLVPRG